LATLEKTPEAFRDPLWRLQAVQDLLHPSTQFVELPQGRFLMGSSAVRLAPNYDPFRWQGELSHWVELAHPGFSVRIQTAPVTQLLWFLVTGKNPSFFKSLNFCLEDGIVLAGVPLCPRLPVEQVSWNAIAGEGDDGEDPSSFLAQLRDSFGISARLPTEAEWERAARGLDETQRHFYDPYFFGRGAADLSDFVWWKENADLQTHPVGLKGWNSLGLADVLGNVNEWVDDFREDFTHAPADRPQVNPRGTHPTLRGVRGGSWSVDHFRNLRTAVRRARQRHEKFFDAGFRLVIDVPHFTALEVLRPPALPLPRLRPPEKP
jgi:formylglycine-generating enzyme required for sulfatase activity